jgi:hypothetical protein
MSKLNRYDTARALHAQFCGTMKPFASLPTWEQLSSQPDGAAALEFWLDLADDKDESEMLVLSDVDDELANEPPLQAQQPVACTLGDEACESCQ